MGRPLKNARRDVVNAILYVTATGCQWRALPERYPHWNTVHRYHLQWSNDGTWEAAADALRAAVRTHEDRDPEPSAGSIDARTVRGASTVTSSTRGYDAGKKISGRKQFGIVDTNGFLLSLAVVPADTSDNTGGIMVADKLRTKMDGFKQMWHDSGFKRTFTEYCHRFHIATIEVARIAQHTFEVLPRRWVVERTWSWIMNNRRLQIDYERDPKVTEGFIWAAHCRGLLRRLTT